MPILACDLGGTRMKIGVVGAGGLLAQSVEPANSQSGLAPQLPVLKRSWLNMLEELNLSVADCAGITVAFPSIVDMASGRLLDSYGKYSDAMAIDLRAWAQTEFGLPLAVDNDARMALIGEWQAGAGRGCNDLVMMTLGTGLGAAAIVDGKPARGRHGQAGILGGHFTVRLDGRHCSCGNVGCAEAETATLFLHDIAAGLPSYGSSSLRDAATLDYALVFQHAAADPCARELRDRSLSIWSATAVNLIHAYDPEILILGGGIMASAEAILPVIQDYLRRHAHTPWGEVRVVASALGDGAALAAGEWLLKERLTSLR
jgi:glucokinase